MTASTTSAAPPDRIRRWPGLLLALAAVLAIYSAVALHGIPQEAANERVLPFLNPLFEGIREQGTWLANFLIEQGFALGGATAAAVWLIALAGLLRGGRKAAPLLLLALAVSAATWGQVLLFQARIPGGIACYAAGILAAVGLGVWCPLRSLPGFPPFPAGPDRPPPEQTPWRPAWWVECVLIVALGVACILSRAWALTELSGFLDLENLSVMVQSRTLNGYLGYLSFGFVENNGGAAHPPLQEILFRVFGTSIFMLRMAAVLWSTAGTLLMYWFARRLGGVLTGVIAALFFIAAPEQLFWGRSENTHFAPTAVLVLITLHLALWMLQRFSAWAVLAVALWTPFTRFFYSAGIVLVAYPIAVALHALVFMRGAWRKAWYVLPLIILGIGLWTVSLTVMKKGLHPDAAWQFVHPAKLYGGTVWTKQGEFANATPMELVRLQAVSMTTNLGRVLHALTINADGFSHWYLRAQAGANRTTQNAGLVVLVALGMGYLIGQIWDRRAFMLLALLGLAVLPGILSADPAARRIAAIYPGFNIIAALFLSALIRLAWQRAGAALGWAAGDGVAVALGAILLTSMATHYSLGTQPVLFGDHVRFAKPLFEDSDVIIHNLDPPALALVLVFGSLDRFLADPPGYQYIPPGRWLRAVLDPRVDFNDPAYLYNFRPEEIAALRETFAPTRVTYLLMDTPATHADVELTRALFPAAQVRQYHSPRDDRLLIAFSVDLEAVEALRRPARWTTGPGPTTVLASVSPTAGRGSPPAPVPEGGAVLGGGILIDQAGWYAWGFEPPCPAATLALDGQPVALDQPRPLLPGVHPFEITVPAAGTCALPVRLQRHSLTDGRTETLRPRDFVSPEVAALPAARAVTALTYDGYGGARPIIEVPGQPAGFGRDRRGELSLLVREHGSWRLRRFAADGHQVLEQSLDFPTDRGISSVVVDDDGTIYAQTERFIAIYDRDGTRIGTIEHEAIVWESEVALWGRDRLLVNFPHRASLAVFSRGGELLEEVEHYAGLTDGQPGPVKFYSPATLATGPDGLLLVRQGDGKALLLRSGPGALAPELVASFPSPSVAHGAAFDGADRLIIPDFGGLRTYDGSGTRLMAREPARDLANKLIPAPARILATPERLLALDVHQNRVFTIDR